MKILSSKPLRLAVFAFTLGVFGLTQSGCTYFGSSATTAGDISYKRGELVAPLAQRYGTVNRAVQAAIEQLQYRKISETQNSLLTVIVVRTPEDRKAQIRVASREAELTDVGISVGRFGSQKISGELLERIKSNL